MGSDTDKSNKQVSGSQSDKPIENDTEKKNEIIYFKPSTSGIINHNGVPCQFLRFDIPEDFVQSLKLHLSGPSPENIRLEARRETVKKTRDDFTRNVTYARNSTNPNTTGGENRFAFGGGGRGGNGRGGSGPPKGNDNNDPFKNITLDSIGGLDSQIAWLKQCVLKPLMENSAASSWGITPPKGVLFYGPPGTGKTLLARAFGNEISKELKRPVKFHHCKGGDLLSKWFGESSRLIRELFAEAIKNKPSVIFFDELDGICPSRDGAQQGEAFNSVVTALLGQMDNVPVGEVFVFGATNRLEAIDPAMRRPGRFDKHLEFLPPNLDGRKKIIRINTKKWKRSHPKEKLLCDLGKKTVGFTGADIEKLCRETFFTAFTRHAPNADLNASIDDLEILMEDWDSALEKVKPSNSAVYGSTLYIPQLPPNGVLPLIANCQKEIIEHLGPLLPRGVENQRSTISNAYDFSVSTRLSTFYIWDQREAGRDALESIILPGVFAHYTCSELPIYMLTKEALLSCPQGGHYSLVSGTINQTVDFLKPCIFFLPRVDEISEDMPGISQVISEQLMKLCGKPVLIIATGSCSSTNLTSKSIRDIFGDNVRSYKIQKPQVKEREEFFRTIFTIASNTVTGGSTCTNAAGAQLKKVWEETVKRTEGDSIETLIPLHGALLQTASKHFPNGNKEPLVADFYSALSLYASSKFHQ